MTVVLGGTDPGGKDSNAHAVEPDLGKGASTQGVPIQDFPRMMSADHDNQQQSTSSFTQVSRGETCIVPGHKSGE